MVSASAGPLASQSRTLEFSTGVASRARPPSKSATETAAAARHANLSLGEHLLPWGHLLVVRSPLEAIIMVERSKRACYKCLLVYLRSTSTAAEQLSPRSEARLPDERNGVNGHDEQMASVRHHMRCMGQRRHPERQRGVDPVQHARLA